LQKRSENRMTKLPTSYAKLYLNDKELTYQIKHSRRARYLRLQINPARGLEVIVPRGCKIEEAEKFIYKKRNWILKHLRTVPVEEQLSYLGEKIEIKQKFDLFLTRHKINFSKGVLLIESPAGSAEDSRLIYNAWLRHIAKIYLPERARRIAEKYRFNPGQVRIRNQKTRWGSCSASGNISLNYKLMKYRKELIDYVIIHELCHLKEMNHSPRFWKLVECLIPEYKPLKRELKRGPIVNNEK
jgi:predicted metal-dependent hydrolase